MSQSSQVDLRGFAYALEPLQHKQQWRMEQLQRQFAKAQAVWLEAKNDLLKLQRMFNDQSELARVALQKRFDPQTHRQTVAYLTQLGQQVEESLLTEANKREEREAIFTDMIEQHKKLDMLVDHKNFELEEYVKEMSRLDQIQVDRDWISRTHFVGKSALGFESQAKERGAYDGH